MRIAAQTQQTPGEFKAGPGYLTPSLEVHWAYNDNLLFEPEGARETFGVSASPRLLYAIGDEAGARLLLDWQLEAAWFESSTDDNYTDNSVNLAWEYRPTTRFFGALSGIFRDMHDFRGTGRGEAETTGLPGEPDRWRSEGAEASLAYGAPTATGRLEFDAGYVDKRYTNNRDFTYIRDREDLYGAGRFYLRVAPKTRLLLEGRQARFTYDRNPEGLPSLDSDSTRFYAGAAWEPTFKTSGSIRVGYIRKDFADALRADTGALGWELDIDWEPSTYSTLSLATARDFRETNGAGDFIRHDSVDASWEHYWLERLSTTVGLQYALDRFNPTVREDDLRQASIGLNYLMRRWLLLSADYRHSARDSTDDLFDFRRNLVELSFRIVL